MSMDTTPQPDDRFSPRIEPQVTVQQVTLPDGTEQISVQSNLAVVPGIWKIIAGFLLQGVQAAMEADIRASLEHQQPLITIPPMGIQKKVLL